MKSKKDIFNFDKVKIFNPNGDLITDSEKDDSQIDNKFNPQNEIT